MKYLYVVDHYVPFPQSEYGGIWLVRAESDEECFDLIYHGNGGFTWSDVYNMPIWARRFYIGKIVEFKTAENKVNQDAMNKSSRGTRK